MLIDRLQTDLITSLKAGKVDRVETIRFLIAGVRNNVTAKYGAEWEKKMTDTDVFDTVKKQIKTHRESIEAFTKGGRQDLVAREKAQLAILEEFAPRQLSDEELRKILEPIAASAGKNLPAGRQDFGLLMKQAMATVKGQADGGKVSAMLKSLL
jgi:uncharacterized protein